MTDYLKRNKVNICLLLLIAGVVSVPLMTDYVLEGTNLQSSLSRIEAVKEGIGNAFPIRIAPWTTSDYGYGAASFQADVFLLIPALFRLLGLGVGFSYKLFLLLINIATAAIAFGCFRKMFGNETIGMMGSMLYTWCPYRCTDLYINGNLGESVAWAFVPIALLGMVQLYMRSVEEQEYKRIWVTLTWGFSLLALSSVTFFSVAVGAAVIMGFAMGKRSLRRETCMCVGKAIIATLLVNAWYLIPMLLRMRDIFVLGSLISKNFRMSGMYFVQYLSLFPTAGNRLDFTGKGVMGAQDMGVGAVVVLLVFIYIWCLFVKKFTDDPGKKILWTVLVLIVLSSNLLPWDLMQNKNMLFSIVLALLQSPAKWGVAACAGLIWIACRMLQKLWESGETKLYQMVLVVSTVISFGVTQLLTGNILRENGTIRPDVAEEWERLPMQALTQESVFWRLCEAVSLVTVCVLLVMWIVRRRKDVKR